MAPRLRISMEGNEIAIDGNKEGLMFLSSLCQNLASLTKEQAQTPANHYHISDKFGNAVEGSIPAILGYIPDL